MTEREMVFVCEDYSTVLEEKKRGIPKRILATRATLQHFSLSGFDRIFDELDADSCFDRNWKGLAAHLIQPPLNSVAIERIAKCSNPSYNVLKMWVEKGEGEHSFDVLIRTMVLSEVYSACDELLDLLTEDDFLCEGFYETLVDAEDVDRTSGGDCPSDIPQRTTENSNAQQQSVTIRPQDVSKEVDVPSNEKRLTTYETCSSKPSIRRSNSCPAGLGWLAKCRNKLKKIFHRSQSAPTRIPQSVVPLAVEGPDTHIIPQDEIFVVSSAVDHGTRAMQEIMSFICKLQPVSKGELTVKTIHDFQLEHQGLMTTAWLEERVQRAKYVILCFSSFVKAIADQQMGSTPGLPQSDLNLRFVLDFLVTGTLFFNLSRNTGGKFVPVLLPGNDMDAIIRPLRFYITFSWPNQKNKFSNYILEKPEYPVPRRGDRKPLVAKAFPCS